MQRALLRTSGTVSVERATSIRENGAWRILIMGPTGAGKSTFIESLGLQGQVPISSGRLAGFTQSVSAYEVVNVTYRQGLIYLVDSPGFVDSKISEMQIVTMLQNWIKDNGGYYFSCILFLTPITSVRIPGSQMKLLRTFQELTGQEAVQHITIVTTMWDSLWSDSGKMRAEENFNQLRDKIWKDFTDKGANLVKFINTQESALSVLGVALRKGSMDYVNFEKMHKDGQSFNDTPFGTNLYIDLKDRIQNLKLQREIDQSELEQALAEDDEILKSVIALRLEETEKDLERFQQELLDFGPPPPSLIQETPEPPKERTVSEAFRSMKRWGKKVTKHRFG